MSRASEHVELELHLAVLGAQQLAEHGVLDRREVDVVQLGADDVGVGLELAVGERRVGLATLEEVVAQVVGVDRRDVEQEAEALGEQGQLVVHGQVGGAELRPGSAGPPSVTAASRARRAGRAVRRRGASWAQRSRSSCSSPVHSSMKVFLNSSASTHPTPRVAVVHPPGESAALEDDVLPGVERAAAERRRRGGPP